MNFKTSYRFPSSNYRKLVEQNGEIKVLTPSGGTLRVRPEAGTPVHYVAGTAQVETTVIVGEIAESGGGNLLAVITAAGMTGSPVTINNIAVDELFTAVQNAAAVRAALIANANVGHPTTGFFTITGAGANVILTAKVAAANDATMNLRVTTGTAASGVNNPTSTNTTAGVARAYATLASKGDQMFDETKLYIAVADVISTSTNGWKSVTIS